MVDGWGKWLGRGMDGVAYEDVSRYLSTVKESAVRTSIMGC